MIAVVIRFLKVQMIYDLILITQVFFLMLNGQAGIATKNMQTHLQKLIRKHS